MFTPTVMEPPPVDTEKMLEWIRNNPYFEYEYFKALGNDITKEEFYQYKWEKNNNSTFFKSYYVTDYRLGWWHQDFVDNFPEIVEWTKTVPFSNPHKRFQLGFVTQRSLEELKQHNRKFCSSIHIDEPDVGIRWFFNNKNNNLFFYKTKKPMAELRHETGFTTLSLNRMENDSLVMNENLGIPHSNTQYVHSDPIKINTSEQNTGWYLNQQNAAHVIAHEMDNPDKITVILDAIGEPEHKWDWYRLDEMMTKSLEKYSSEAIMLNDY